MDSVISNIFGGSVWLTIGAFRAISLSAAHHKKEMLRYQYPLVCNGQFIYALRRGMALNGRIYSLYYQRQNMAADRKHPRIDKLPERLQVTLEESLQLTIGDKSEGLIRMGLLFSDSEQWTDLEHSPTPDLVWATAREITSLKGDSADDLRRNLPECSSGSDYMRSMANFTDVRD